MYLIAEIGCNHKGSLSIAKEMIEVASKCGVDAVKFQKRCNKELLTEAEYNTPHQVEENSYGKTYGEHREYLEFDIDQHVELKDIAHDNSVRYGCSVWDLRSAEEIVSIKPDFIKIPSAMNRHKKLLEYICNYADCRIDLSLGMTTTSELFEITTLLEQYDRLEDTVLYYCTSGYPVPFNQVCLKEISSLSKKFKDRTLALGYSGHHLGIAIDVAAYMLGAEYIERHFTLDRTWKGTDHAASLEPNGLEKLSRDLKNVETAMTRRDKEILDIEKPTRKKLKKLIWQ